MPVSRLLFAPVAAYGMTTNEMLNDWMSNAAAAVFATASFGPGPAIPLRPKKIQSRLDHILGR